MTNPAVSSGIGMQNNKQILAAAVVIFCDYTEGTFSLLSLKDTKQLFD